MNFRLHFGTSQVGPCPQKYGLQTDENNDTEQKAWIKCDERSDLHTVVPACNAFRQVPNPTNFLPFFAPTHKNAIL